MIRNASNNFFSLVILFLLLFSPNIVHVWSVVCTLAIWAFECMQICMFCFLVCTKLTFIFVLQFLVRKWMLLGVFCIFFFTLLSSFLSLWFACLALSHTLSEIYEKCESVIVTILIFWRKVFFFALPIQL